MDGQAWMMGAFKHHAFSFLRSLNGAMWINNYLDENEPQANKKCCEFCNTEVPDNIARRFGCPQCNARYCSKEHKKADFRFHKMRCMNFNHNSPFPNTTNSFIGDPYCQSSTLHSALRTDNDNYIPTTFQTYQQTPSAEFSGNRSNTNQLSPVRTNQDSVSPHRVTLQPPQMQYGQSNPTSSTSPGCSGEGLSYMQNPSPYQNPNNQFFLTTTEKLPSIQATQTRQTQPGLASYLNVPNTCANTQMGTVQMPSYSNDDDQITLEDALSFLDEQEARQYPSPQQQQQQQQQVQTQQLSPLPSSNVTTSPVPLISTGETPSAEQYQQLLLMDSNSSISSQMLPIQGDQGSMKHSQTLSPTTSNTIPSEQQSQQSPLSPENNEVGKNDEMPARFCEHFGLLNESSDAGPPLKEEGIFSRYDLREVAQYIVQSLCKNNYCIVDFLHGEPIAANILEEVKEFHQENAFSEGLLSSSKGNKGSAKKNVREDLVAWTDGKGKKAIKKHMSRMDLLLKFCNKFIKECEVSSRTQAMVACYPGGGTGYKQHIDNPSKDGRCVTTLYYLNPDWNIKTDGGILKLFPSGTDRKTVNVEPYFDRLLLFWSDRRTPHEVTPAFKVRYAITLWYFDEQERKEYINRYKEGKV
ncbi:putative uncharacterized protein DDB_G0282129 [Actinia tenebrosa]|uniref:hypoxia-inducible factor-proline dioxygenase n=1 Tax=Actinia tenebrosa TaxID=6105 RepID=A0A6P8IJ67_ACTTE|nr:putative uncharacterized protein DDB_G0282129 [Actinia tenebrosa]